MSLSYLAGKAYARDLQVDGITLFQWDTQCNNADLRLQSLIEGASVPVFKFLQRSLLDISDETNPLRERLEGKSEDEKLQIVNRHLTKLSRSYINEFIMIFLKYTRFQDSFLYPLRAEDFKSEENPASPLDRLKAIRFRDSFLYPLQGTNFSSAFLDTLEATIFSGSFLDPLQAAIFELSNEEDCHKKMLINSFIKEYIKHLSFYHKRTELTKKIKEGKKDEARKYISEIPKNYRKAFFQIVEKRVSESKKSESGLSNFKKGVGHTILHNAILLNDINLVEEILDELKDIPREELQAFLESKSIFTYKSNNRMITRRFNAIELAINAGSLEIIIKLIELIPKEILANMLNFDEKTNPLLQAITECSLAESIEVFERRREILKEITEEIKSFSPELQKRCIRSNILLKIMELSLRIESSSFINRILWIIMDDELKFSLLSATTDSNENLLNLAVKQKNEKLVLIILKNISLFSSELQKKLISSDILLQKIRMISEKSNSDFPDFVNFMVQIKDDELRFSLLRASTDSGIGLLQFAIEQDNEQLAIAILSAINQLKDDDKKIICLSSNLLANAVEKKMKWLVEELLKNIPQIEKREYLKKVINYRYFITENLSKEAQGNALEVAIDAGDENIAILIFKEILKLDLQDKRNCINSNLLYKALKHKMSELATLILSSIKPGENNLEEVYFIEFLQYSEQSIFTISLKDIFENVLQLALKNNYDKISQMILERIQKLDIKDQIKWIFRDEDIFKYLFLMRKSNLLKEIIENILKKTSEEDIAKIFNEGRIYEKRRFLESYLEDSEENDFITVFKMIPENYAHLYLKHSLLSKAIHKRKFVVALELINIIKSFSDNNQKAEALYEMRRSALLTSVRTHNLDLTKAILSVFESSPDEQWKLLKFSNSVRETALHRAARLRDKSYRENIIKVLLRAISKEKRSKFLKMEEKRNKKSVFTMLVDDELKEYVYPLLTSKEQEKLSNNRPKKKARFGDHQFQPSSSSSSSSSSRVLPIKRKR